MTMPDIGSAIGSGQPGKPQGDIRPFVTPMTPNAGLEDPREAAIWTRLRLRHFTPSGTGVNAAVTSGSTNVAITFKRREPNTTYGLSIIPSWSTTVYVPTADKAITGFTARFGTAAGANDVIQWATFRSEDT